MTVVAVVTRDHIIVANCNYSRVVLCRNGEPVALSVDHKPGRPDELKRIEAAGGDFLYWEGARVCGCLAMSRAIGGNYLKSYVTCEPEVTVIARTTVDECLILASDGLWVVSSNHKACGLARRCLERDAPSTELEVSDIFKTNKRYTACSNASMLLTKIALEQQSTDNITVVIVDLHKNRVL